MQNFRSSTRQLPNIFSSLVIILVSFAAGICWAEHLTFPRNYLITAVFILIGIQLFSHFRNQVWHPAVSRCFLGLLFLLLGLLQNSRLSLTPPAWSDHIYNSIQIQQPGSIIGVLQKCPSVINSSSGSSTRFILKVHSVYLAENLRLESYRFQKATGLVLLTLNGLLPESLKPGDLLMVKANLSRVHTYSTPGAFNYKEYLAGQSVFVRGWVKTPKNIIKVYTTAPPWTTAILVRLRYLPERIRSSIALFLDRTLDQPARGIYKAIIIGDRNDVPRGVLNNFTEAGCMHILAISGMHMGLLALMMFAVVFWLLKRSTWLLLFTPVNKVAVSIAYPPLLFYSLIAGANIPVLRALLMSTALIMAVLSDRPACLLNHIILAAFLLLIWKPWTIYSVSFQLSFGAVIAIALIYPLLSKFVRLGFTLTDTVPQNHTSHNRKRQVMYKLLQEALKWVLTGLTLTAAALLGTLPLLLFHFNRFSPVALLSNLLVEPLICFWSLPIGLVASLNVSILPGLAKVFFSAGAAGLVAAEKICQELSALPYSSLWLPTPSALEITAFYLFLLGLVLGLYFAGRLRCWLLITSFIFLGIYCSAPRLEKIINTDSGIAAVTFLDVGHGAAILLQLPQEKNVLIDGGSAVDKRFDIGAGVIGPFLWKQKLNRLDAVIITHPHADHYSGLPFILTQFRPRELWINGSGDSDSEYQKILSLARKLGIEIKIARSDAELLSYDNTRLSCIHSGVARWSTTPGSEPFSINNTNNASMVLRLQINDKFFLFPADIEAGMAEYLAKSGKNITADVLAAPHHGSPASLSWDFITGVNPDFIAVSSGRSSTFSFQEKSLNELQKQGIKIYSTSKDGTITFTVKSSLHDKIEVNCYQVN